MSSSSFHHPQARQFGVNNPNSAAATGPCMSRGRSAFTAMAGKDLARFLSQKRTTRASALRAARCDCILQQFLEGRTQRSQQQQQQRHYDGAARAGDSDAALNSVMTTTETTSGENTPESVSQLIAQLFPANAAMPSFQQHENNNNNRDISAVQTQLLPSYWLSEDASLRCNILTALLRSLDGAIARACVAFGESVNDCTCGARERFHIMSDEEGHLLHSLLTRVVSLVESNVGEQNNHDPFSLLAAPSSSNGRPYSPLSLSQGDLHGLVLDLAHGQQQHGGFVMDCSVSFE